MNEFNNFCHLTNQNLLLGSTIKQITTIVYVSFLKVFTLYKLVKNKEMQNIFLNLFLFLKKRNIQEEYSLTVIFITDFMFQF